MDMEIPEMCEGEQMDCLRASLLKTGKGRRPMLPQPEVTNRRLVQLHQLRYEGERTTAEKPVETAVRKKLTEALQPDHLDVINESYMHNVPKGTESHFKVVIVSSAFENVKRIEKHQLVHKALKEELDNSIHALSIVAKTPKEWESSKEIGKSPPCQGGAGL